LGHSLPATSALAINSASLGAGLQVQSSRAITRGNLYLLVGAQSGTAKTLVLNVLQEPLDQFQDELMTLHKRDALPGIQAEEKLLDIQIRDLLKGDTKDQGELANLFAKSGNLEDRKNSLTRLWTTDVTSQALGELLGDNNEQMSVISAEGGLVLFNLLKRYSSSDDALLCAGYSGDRVSVDRITREAIILHRPWLSLFLAVQPDLLYRATERRNRSRSKMPRRSMPRIMR
jgi:Protein of unknown function (DUF3987)